MIQSINQSIYPPEISKAIFKSFENVKLSGRDKIFEF